MAADNESKQQPDKLKPEPEKKKIGWLSWERDVEVLKIAVTFYAACIGTFVTFQFNERQHELNRIEAIAKMLPHLDESSSSDDEPSSAESESPPAEPPDNTASTAKPTAKKHSHKMTRDGAIWAIFRTANNKTMLRDLAALFPEDIYRVVSSIAASGGLNNDDDALTALQVSSEKLANKYAAANDTVLASRLYHQALKLKQRTKGSDESFTIVDITDQALDEPTGDDHIAEMLKSLNKLGEIHRNESESGNKVSTGRWNAKQMYKRVRELGKKSTSNKAKAEVIIADTALTELYIKDHRLDTARVFLAEAVKLSEDLNGKDSKLTADLRNRLSQLDTEIKTAAPTPVPPTTDGTGN